MLIPIEAAGPIASLRGDEEWQADRLAQEVERRTGLLASKGIGRGDRVLVRHGGSAAFFADLFAVWRSGGCAVCLNPTTTDPELANLAAFTEARLVLIEDGGRVPQGLSIDTACLAEGEAGGSAPSLPGDRLDDEALILFTSGTTGDPKGVVHSFRSLLARIALNAQHIGREDMANTLCVLPTHFGHGLIGNALTPLLSGCRLVLGAGTNVQAAAQLGAAIDKQGITFMSSVPSFWKLVLKVSKPPQGGTLRRVHVGSAPLSADVWQQIIDWSGIDNVINMYGITETANWLGGANARDGGPGDGRIGRMWGGFAAVKGEDGVIRRTGEGLIMVQSPSLMNGYFRRPDLTDPVLYDGWFDTGDIGRIDESGEAWLTGRAKYEINRGGMKVHPEDIDILLERNEAVQEACAFAIADAVMGEAVGVAVVASGDDLDLDALKDWCKERIVREKMPDRWFVLAEIPKTDRGKINRNVVAEACLEMAAAGR